MRENCVNYVPKCVIVLVLVLKCVCFSDQDVVHEIGLYPISEEMQGDFRDPVWQEQLRLPPMHHINHMNRPGGQPNFGPLQHAGVPRGLQARAVPLKDSDHELMLNVSWIPSMGTPAKDYSIEVRSETLTSDCEGPMCFEYNIPGDVTWWAVPPQASTVVGACAVRPGCTYSVRLIAHPWDGHTSANILVNLPECAVGVCSCAHAPRLPIPRVLATTLTLEEEVYANVTWWLPEPQHPQRLPPDLQKKGYLVSIGRQMVSDAHPSPWFAHTITRSIETSGSVFTPENPRWLLIPLVEEQNGRQDDGENGGQYSGLRSESRSEVLKKLLQVKLLARVSLIDGRECFGPAGNATAFDPAKHKKAAIGSYILWAAIAGAFAMATAVAIIVAGRSVKRMLRTLRPKPSEAALQPLRVTPTWMPMHVTGYQQQLKMPCEARKRSEMPLYASAAGGA